MKSTYIVIIIIAFVIFLVIILWIKNKYIPKLIDRRIAAYQNDLVEKHVQEVQNMYQQMRGWRHDYKNHIQTMKAYLMMDEIDKLKGYFEELDTDLNSMETVLKTGNVMMDAVLNSKISLANSKHIQVEAKAIVPETLNISDIDLSTIIGNLMDNAMEACLKVKVEQRFIRVYIDILKGQLYIYVMNAMNESPHRQGRIYLSTKNSRNHGFGLGRIDKVVGKYNGFLERQDEKGVFATEILLPLK